MKTNVVLITGFEPWGDISVNPSKDYVETDPKFEGWEVSTCVLSVSDECFGEFDRAIEVHNPAIILSLGLAADRSQIEVERQAKRTEKSEPGPAIMESDLSPTACRMSDDAGEFFCNDLYFHGLRRCSQEGRRMAFIHVPKNVRFSDIDDVILNLLCQC